MTTHITRGVPRWELPCGCRVGVLRYLILTGLVRTGGVNARSGLGQWMNSAITWVFDRVHGSSRRNKFD